MRIEEKDSLHIEIVRAIVSWIYSRQKIEALMISLELEGVFFKGVYVLGLGTIQVMGRFLGFRVLRAFGNLPTWVTADAIVEAEGLGRCYVSYEVRASSIVVKDWEGSDSIEEFEDVPVEASREKH